MYFCTDLQTRNPSVSQVNIILKTKEVINSDFNEEAGTKPIEDLLMDFKNIWK